MNSQGSSRGRDSAETGPTSAGSSRSSSQSSRPKIYRCDYDGCDKLYSRPSLLTQHQRSHTDSRPFRCAVCSAAFYRESHLNTHALSHSDEKPFQCSICGKGVNTRQHLKRHEVTHTKSFACDFDGCAESFYKHQQLRHHVQSVHLKSLTCKECGKDFPRPYRLANHMAKQHGSSPAYQCDYPGCLKNLMTWSALLLHMKTDHPKLACAVCGKGCVGQEGLRMHMLVHDEEKSLKRWKCSECPTEFAKKEELVVHCTSVHKFIPNSVKELLKPDAARILSTEKVEVVLSQMSAPELLLSSVKEVDPVLKCPMKYCVRTFRRAQDMKRHMDWHAKKKELAASGAVECLQSELMATDGSAVKGHDANSVEFDSIACMDVIDPALTASVQTSEP